mmetsp:Transcript_27834/g.64673  ORF Transcript_27834/g.64673 Transcript_27834/m.64673 type:complete len:101 (-) Transcript_27834:207-509(-)
MAKSILLAAILALFSLSSAQPLRGMSEEIENPFRRLEELPSCDPDKDCCGFEAYELIDGKCVEVDPNTSSSALLSMICFVAAPVVGIPVMMYMKVGAIKM